MSGAPFHDMPPLKGAKCQKVLPGSWGGAVGVGEKGEGEGDPDGSQPNLLGGNTELVKLLLSVFFIFFIPFWRDCLKTR
jgi:hypothetical protein